uniref:Uncharacterized protein n=1 Tax=Timema douglasi TaxID=61478 RepID=A0A7R8Z6M9_TIMDO|nr:unnamed protein product [Timema douglasi]
MEGDSDLKTVPSQQSLGKGPETSSRVSEGSSVGCSSADHLSQCCALDRLFAVSFGALTFEEKQQVIMKSPIASIFWLDKELGSDISLDVEFLDTAHFLAIFRRSLITDIVKSLFRPSPQCLVVSMKTKFGGSRTFISGGRWLHGPHRAMLSRRFVRADAVWCGSV